MKKTENPLNKIVIVGGGTSGWIAAATLAHGFRNANINIELVESEQIGTIGVGEATIPSLMVVLNSLGISLDEFVKETQGSFKLGIQFEDWHSQGENYFHPFGGLGKTIAGFDFFQCWLKCKAEGDLTPLMAHSPEAVLAERDKFFLPFNVQNTPLERAFYALHLDSTLAGKYFRNFAEKLGVKRTEGLIESVTQYQNGNIQSVTLESGNEVKGDFFIDCSGFRGLLIEQTLHSGYEDWSEYLPCNRAVTVQTKNIGSTKPYTVSKARDAGWTWRIPLQHRTGNGYVFCDKYISDDEAIKTLLSAVEGEPLSEPRVIPFTTGIRKKAWQKNCLALGLAQGFIEPLESTAIHLVTRTLAYFIRMFPDTSCQQELQDEFNRRVRVDYEEIRDFLVLHYCTTSREDTEFWRWCKQMPIPESLQQKIDFFKASGGLIPGVESLFQPSSWYAIFNGMKVMPTRYNPALDTLAPEKLKTILAKGANGLIEIAEKQPSHDQFLEQYCQAPLPGNK
ncbi:MULTISPECIES: tryptophan halogenase family protein [Thalassotalea]|uniref:tryptophan halogenase family protein n=1 Tax=Thalassotalea TaxID=1518149 RepID=UPI000941EAB5|nr:MULTISPECIES: tryptophan halogenase family protein [Thalassotalea]OKY26077.1 tryptophan halogenase [Thalassotalea sp. PP2-459]